MKTNPNKKNTTQAFYPTLFSHCIHEIHERGKLIAKNNQLLEEAAQLLKEVDALTSEENEDSRKYNNDTLTQFEKLKDRIINMETRRNIKNLIRDLKDILEGDACPRAPYRGSRG